MRNIIIASGNSEETKKVSIKPSSLGLMAPMFKSINLEVILIVNSNASHGDVVMLIKLRYDYQHPSGSNGYEIAWRYDQGSWRDW